MADARRTTSYEGIGFRAETFSIDNSTITYSATAVGGAAATMIGKAVTESAAGVVALAADGEFIKGKLLLVEADGKCTVQTKGYATFPGGNGASLTRGKKIVGAVNASSEKGYVREVATGTAAELGRQIGQIVDASDTTNVWVDLG